MIDALPHLSMVPPLVLAVLLLGGLALRAWGARRLALLGSVLIWLALAFALYWFVSGLVAILPLIGS